MNSWLHIQSCIFSNPSSSRTFFPVTCYSRRQTAPKISITHQAIPARDRIIDFGKYKGKMLGTLPSSYLKWVSKNLRARDFEEWAKLADQVLQDPTYNDRIEWEFAANVLNGNQLKTASSTAAADSSAAVAELLDMSERFGWDNNDKAGWKNINFELLGTSKGGRIPRLNKIVAKDHERGMTKQEEPSFKQQPVSGDEVRRRKRREMVKMRREATMVESKLGIKGKVRGSFVNQNDADDNKEKVCGPNNKDDDNKYDEMVQRNHGNPFPGREALLRKALNRRGLGS